MLLQLKFDCGFVVKAPASHSGLIACSKFKSHSGQHGGVSFYSRHVKYSMQLRRMSEYLIMAFHITPHGNGSPV